MWCREQILARKRREYRDMVPEYYDIANGDRSEEEMGALRQVIVDVPRTAPGVAFFHEAPVQKCLERILYIWGIRCVCLCRPCITVACCVFVCTPRLRNALHCRFL